MSFQPTLLGAYEVLCSENSAVGPFPKCAPPCSVMSAADFEKWKTGKGPEVSSAPNSR